MRIKPFHLTTLVIIVKIAIIIYFSIMMMSMIQTQHQVTVDFYDQPFKVSTASIRLEKSLAKIRVDMLQLLRTENQIEAYNIIEEVGVASLTSKKQVDIILEGFLGDMNRVYDLEAILNEWAQLRAKIIEYKTHGKSLKAMDLAMHQGHDLFTRSERITSYISDYAQNKAEFFERKSTIEYHKTMLNVLWTMSLVVILLISAGVYVLRTLFLHDKKLEKDAYVDALTNLFNRHYFTVSSKILFSQAKRQSQKLSLLMLDIDLFKQINDQYGHHAGDEVLKRLAEFLKTSLRDSDICCRWGGEEFVVLMPETDIDGAMVIAQHIKKGIETLPVHYNGFTVFTTISIGVSELQNHRNIEEILEEADQALYYSKKTGRNRVTSFKDI